MDGWIDIETWWQDRESEEGLVFLFLNSFLFQNPWSLESDADLYWGTVLSGLTMLYFLQFLPLPSTAAWRHEPLADILKSYQSVALSLYLNTFEWNSNSIDLRQKSKKLLGVFKTQTMKTQLSVTQLFHGFVCSFIQTVTAFAGPYLPGSLPCNLQLSHMHPTLTFPSIFCPSRSL